jgi:hypothetical protein
MQSSLTAAALGLSILLTSLAHGQAKPKPPIDQQVTDSVQDARIRNLESRVEASHAVLNCTSGGYDSLVMASPKLLVFAVCRNIEPFLEGYRLSVEVGNPYSFSFGGISGQVRYGKDYADRSVDINFAGDFVPGRWTPFTVTINPAKAEDLRHLQMTLRASTVAPR